jgi:hypothetical protein
MNPDLECTFWMNGWPTWLGGSGDEWLHCCQAHDLVPMSLESTFNLGQCVSEVSPIMGSIMFLGVFIFGPIYGIIKYKGTMK